MAKSKELLTGPRLHRRHSMSGIDTWLEVPLAGQWVAAYRLAFSGRPQARRFTVLEVRVFPNEPGRQPDAKGRLARFTPGEWSGTGHGKRTPGPSTFSFDRLRDLSERGINIALKAVLQNIEKQGAARAFGLPSSRRELTTEGRGAGRKGLPRVFYAEFALSYEAVELERGESRDRGASTERALVEIYSRRLGRHIPATTVKGWISRSRRYGFLTAAAGEGSRGGWATPLARRIAGR